MPSSRVRARVIVLSFCFFNDTATTEIYTLSLHDALPISDARDARHQRGVAARLRRRLLGRERRGHALRRDEGGEPARSEEHTSELQSRQYLVCRLLLAQ